MSESISVTLGDPLPLSFVAPDGASGLFPRAYIRDSAGVAVGAPIDLAAASAPSGSYFASGPTTTGVGFFTAQFVVFTTSPGVGESTTYRHDQDSFTVKLAQVAASGAAINTTATGDSTITTGSTIAGDVTETIQLDGTYWQIDDDAGTLDMYFEFAISADGSPTSVTHTGRVNGANDNLNVYAWNWGGAAWEQIGARSGQGSSSDSVEPYDLFTQHVGTGGDLGKVRVRFSGTGLTNADFYTDQIFLSYAVVSRSVGYALGAIWLNTTGGGTAGTTPNINGTADNPVDSLTDAITLSTSTNLKLFALSPGSSISLSQTFDGYVFFGDRWSVDLNGQAIPSSVIIGAAVSGICTGAIPPRFSRCDMGIVTVPPCVFNGCGLEGATITLGSAGDYFWDQPYSRVAGTGTPIINFGVAVGTTNLNLRHVSAGFEFQNMGKAGTDTISLEGDGQFIVNANCDSGTIAVRGNFDRTDNSGGAVLIVDTARYSVQQVRDAMKLAPSAGAPVAASVDEHLDDILADTSVIEPLVSANLDATITGIPAAVTVYLETTGPNPHGTGLWTGTTPAAVATAVWATVLIGFGDEDEAGGMLNWIYRAIYHRQEVDFVTQRLEIYNKAGTAVIGYWPMTDGDGLPIMKATGSPARRGVFV